MEENINEIIKIIGNDNDYLLYKSNDYLEKNIINKDKLLIFKSIDNNFFEYNEFNNHIETEKKNIIKKLKESKQLILCDNEVTLIKFINLENRLLKINENRIDNNNILFIKNCDLSNELFIDKNKLTNSENFIINNYKKLVSKYNLNLEDNIPFLTINNIDFIKNILKDIERKNIICQIKFNKNKKKIIHKYEVILKDINHKLNNIKMDIENIRSNNISNINNNGSKEDNNNFTKYLKTDTPQIFFLIKQYKNDYKKKNIIIEEKNVEMELLNNSFLQENIIINNSGIKCEKKNVKNSNFIVSNIDNFNLFYRNINIKFYHDTKKYINFIKNELENCKKSLCNSKNKIDTIENSIEKFEINDISWIINNYKIYKYYYDNLNKYKNNIIKMYKKYLKIIEK